MKTLKEIKNHFEHKDYFYRVEFIEEYDFHDDYRDYYEDFLLRETKIRDAIYLSELIDLAAWLKIFHTDLYSRYVKYLFEKRPTIVKLAVLDYLIDCPLFYNDDSIEEILVDFFKTTKLLIVKKQTLLCLLALKTDNSKFYYESLKSIILKTEDWRGVYRLLNNIKRKKQFKPYQEDLLVYIQKQHNKKQFGEGVERLLEELKPARSGYESGRK